MADTSLHAAIECNRAIFETDFSAEMRQVRLPTLIIHGDSDASISAEISARKSAELIPGSALKIYANGPHALYFTHMQQLEEDLVTFVRAQPRGGRGSRTESTAVFRDPRIACAWNRKGTLP
jgi:pimeloyl-ACP methyl ester carboxylesterase